jgi:hypothetical protein
MKSIQMYNCNLKYTISNNCLLVDDIIHKISENIYDIEVSSILNEYDYLGLLYCIKYV